MRNILVIVAGGLMLLAGCAHGILGWKFMHAELLKAHADAELISGLGVGWLWGGASMLTFGAIVTICGMQMRRGNSSGALAVRAIAVCYFVFGVAAFVAEGFDPHFLIFAVLGLLAGASFLGAGAAKTDSWK